MHVKTLIFFFLCSATTALHPFTLMIQPAGNTRHPGRSIHGSYERGLSIQLAEFLQEALEQKDPSIKVIIPRFSGQAVEPLQNANIANRLSVDAYIALMLYEQQESNPQLALYTYSSDPSDAFKTMQTTSLQFIAFDQAHIPHLQTSAGMAQVLLDTLKTKPLFTITGNRVHMLPLKNLTGILAPQIALELVYITQKKLRIILNLLLMQFGR